MTQHPSKPPFWIPQPCHTPQSASLRRRKAQTVSLGKRSKPVTLAPALPPRAKR